jgi:hypothetical protein
MNILPTRITPGNRFDLVESWSPAVLQPVANVLSHWEFNPSSIGSSNSSKVELDFSNPFSNPQ